MSGSEREGERDTTNSGDRESDRESERQADCLTAKLAHWLPEAGEVWRKGLAGGAFPVLVSLLSAGQSSQSTRFSHETSTLVGLLNFQLPRVN